MVKESCSRPGRTGRRNGICYDPPTMLPLKVPVARRILSLADIADSYQQRYPFTVNNKPWLEHLKEVSYKDEIEEFKNIVTRLGEKHNWTLADLQARFSNELFDKLYFTDVHKPLAAQEAEKQGLRKGYKVVLLYS